MQTIAINFLCCLGLYQLGFVVYFLVQTISFYIRNKAWPLHPAELLLQQEKAITKYILAEKDSRIEYLEEKITELENDLQTIWSKTLNRLPEK
jgi:hypothetical protein